MTVSEFIDVLKDLPQDANVCVKYRDSGGDYYGADFDIYPLLVRNSTDEEIPNGSVVI